MKDDLLKYIKLKLFRAQMNLKSLVGMDNKRFIDTAKAEMVDNLDLFFRSIYEESLRYYHDNYQQNHYTVQAQHDFRASLNVILSKYIKDYDPKRTIRKSDK